VWPVESNWRDRQSEQQQQQISDAQEVTANA